LKTRNPPFPAGFKERMMGLEPTTFCMATAEYPQAGVILLSALAGY
jgi:hypothetical protein